MTEHAPDRIWSGIDIPKTLAGALAAVCAAVIGSFLGVAGTLIGAAVASIVGSIGTEIYQHSIRRGTQKLQTLAPTFVRAPAAVGTPEVGAATEDDSPSHAEPPATPLVRRVRWKPILIGAGLVFALAMGTILAVETFADRSLASITGNGAEGGNTLSNLVGNDDKSNTDTPAPAVSVTPPATTTEQQDPGVAPGTTPTTTAPATDGGTTDTTTPTTEAPTTTAPEQDAPDTGGADQDQPAAESEIQGNADAEQ